MTATKIASSTPGCRKSGSWKTTGATIASMTDTSTAATTIGVTTTGGTMIAGTMAGMTTAATTTGVTTVAMVAAGTPVTIAGTVATEIPATGIRATAGITNA